MGAAIQHAEVGLSLRSGWQECELFVIPRAHLEATNFPDRLDRTSRYHIALAMRLFPASDPWKCTQRASQPSISRWVPAWG